MKHIPSNYQDGRNSAKRHVRGKIAGRANVGFEEDDWRYIVWLAKDTGQTISDIIRFAVQRDRECVINDVFEDGDKLPWREDVLMQRFAHVEVTYESDL